jgi:hypothetical protein
MPETRTGAGEPAHAKIEEEPETSVPWWKMARTAALASAALAVIAVAVAVAAWFRAAPNSPTYSDSQTSKAKVNVCAAYMTVRQGVVANTHLKDPHPNDPAGQLAVAANARLALLGGGAYLRDRLAAQPATPADLTKAVDSLADTIEQLGVNYLAGADNSIQDPLRKNLDGQIGQVSDLCK